MEGPGEDGAHAFDGRLVQAVVGRQHLPVRDKQATTTQCACHAPKIKQTKKPKQSTMLPLCIHVQNWAENSAAIPDHLRLTNVMFNLLELCVTSHQLEPTLDLLLLV